MFARLRLVPPSPDVMAALYMDYTRDGKPVGLTFAQYLHAIGYGDPAAQIDGMDDGLVRSGTDGDGPELISVPTRPITGALRLIVLLVDFADNAGTRPPQRFRDLLFSDGTFPTGSLRDYYREVSGDRVHIEGSVHGWLRLPQPYSFYANDESGMGRSPSDDSYPRNARRMAEDAVAAALAAGVSFDPELDKLGDGTVTALFIVHAGRGAEELAPAIRKKHIWSHKWELRTPADVAAAGQPALQATRYLTVPEDCNMGVCAHELGHLAFQWEDFYDPNGTAEGQWAGSGNWDLMAGGSWNGNRGDTPAHPVGLHKLQHGWVTAQQLDTTAAVTIPPLDASGGAVVVVRGPGYGASQSLLLENRQPVGFDRRLPGAGLLVWRVDLDREQGGATRPALQLVQADGRGDLDTSFGGNQGDAGDPFPGTARQTSVEDAPGVRRTTSFRGARSGVGLSNISVDPVTRAITLTVTVAAAPDGPAPALAPPAAEVAATSLPALGLDRLLSQERVTASELQRYVVDATPSVIDIEKRARNALLAPGAAEGIDATPASPAKKAKGGRPARAARAKPPKATAHRLAAAARVGSPADDFGGLLWRAYKWANGVTWDREGRFFGVLDVGTQLRQVGDRDYLYTPHATDPFGYATADGTTVTPGKMVTDGGSTPRVAWLIPDLDPWTYLKAYLIHDWEFLIHHCRPHESRTFEAANHTLAEGVFTLMMAGEVTADWRKVAVVHSGVSSFVGRGVWDKVWDVPACAVAMPGA